MAGGLGTNVGSRIYFPRPAFEGLYLGLLAGGLGTNVGSGLLGALFWLVDLEETLGFLSEPKLKLSECL